MIDFHRPSHILSSPVDRSTVEDGNDVASATHGWAFIGVINCFPATYVGYLITCTLCFYSVLILYIAYHIARGRSHVFLYQSTGS